MLQGVSWEQSVDIGKSNCSQRFLWCPRLKSSLVLKLTLSPTFNNFCLMTSLPSINLTCGWQYPPFPIAVIQMRTKFIVISMIEGVSRDRRFNIGQSNCSRLLAWFLKLKTLLLLKGTFSQSSDTLSSDQTVDISASEFSWHLLKCSDLLSKRELKSLFSPWPKE